MKKTSYRIVSTVLFLFLTQSSIAGGWGQDQEIDLLYLHPSANGAYLTQANMANPDGCSLSDFYVLSKANTNYNEIYSLVLAARIAGRDVQFYLSGCHYQRPVVSLVQL